VLPTIAPELGYDTLGEVADGQAVQMAYLEMINADTSSEQKDEIAVAVREYCARDTEGMLAVMKMLTTWKCK
jgi:hypothetical protein